MRRARGGKFIMHEGVFIGIDLGADFCAEHEWGIAGIRNSLGIPSDCTAPELHGIKGRTITRFDERMFFFKKNKTHACLTFEGNSFGGELRGWKCRELDNDPKELATAWSERDFGIVVEKSYAPYLEELYEAFKRHDIAIGIGGVTNPFQNGGLSIIIASRFPADVNEKVKAADADYVLLRKTAEETGIAKRLEKAGKKYFALSPRWADDEKTKVHFWLNPHDQHITNYGWFTVEDLDLWIAGKGKIPKKKGE